MGQTSYSINTAAVGFAGAPVDIAHQHDVVSGLAVAAAVPYGVLVVLDSANSDGFDKIAAKVPALTTDVTNFGSALGVVLADQARAQDPAFVLPSYARYDALPIMRSGRVWVLVEEAVVDGDPVFIRFAAGAGGTQLGAFRKSADTATAVALPNAVYRSSGLAAGFAVVQLNLL